MVRVSVRRRVDQEHFGPEPTNLGHHRISVRFVHQKTTVFKTQVVPCGQSQDFGGLGCFLPTFRNGTARTQLTFRQIQNAHAVAQGSVFGQNATATQLCVVRVGRNGQ